MNSTEFSTLQRIANKQREVDALQKEINRQEKQRAEERKARAFEAAKNERLYGSASQVWLRSKSKLQRIMQRAYVTKGYIHGPSLLRKDGPVDIRVHFDWPASDIHIDKLHTQLRDVFGCDVDLTRCDCASIRLIGNDTNWQVV